MNTTRLLIGLGLGVGVALLLGTDKGKDIRDDVADRARKLQKKLSKLAARTGADLDDLQALVKKNISGLGEDARERILDIIDASMEKAKNAKERMSSMA